MYDFHMDKINAICPKCGNTKYMYHMSGRNVGSINVKCTNCNSYFRWDEISEQSELANNSPKLANENDELISRADAINAMENINRVFNDLGLSCAYDMPSFWYNNGKDYKVIPTRYHKGYQQALSDAEKRIKLILEELCYG